MAEPLDSGNSWVGRRGAAPGQSTDASERPDGEARPAPPVTSAKQAGNGSPGLSRYAEIGRFLLKYRKAGVFKDLALDDALAEEAARDQPPIPEGKPEEFARDLEALGPTFVKIGQTLSTRPDLIPEPYMQALERMQDDVAPVPFDQIREIIEAELGGRLSKIFQGFDETPLASASLGQVHAATLRGDRKVVVKVQRPNITQTIKSDLDVLARSAGAVDKLTDVGRRYRFADWVEQFRQTMASELDYRMEAENLARFGSNLSNYERLYVPRPFPDLSTSRVLTMERIEGVKVTSAQPLRRTEEDLDLLGADLMRAYLDQVFVHGQIHADPHPGNVFLMHDGRLALLDFGQVAHLSTSLRTQLLKLLGAIVDGRGEDAAEVCIALGTRLEDFREPEFVREASRLIAQYGAYESSTVSSEGRLMLDLTRLGASLGLRPPPELTLLGKTFVNLDAVLIALDPDVEVRTTVKGHLRSVMFRQFLGSLSPGTLATEMIETQELLREAPRRIFSILRMLSDNRFRIHITGLEESHLMESLQKIANRITAGVICTGLLVCGAMMMRHDTATKLFGLPAIALLMIVVAAVLGIALILTSLLSDRTVGPKEDHGPK